jgi:hypothetical protein
MNERRSRMWRSYQNTSVWLLTYLIQRSDKSQISSLILAVGCIMSSPYKTIWILCPSRSFAAECRLSSRSPFLAPPPVHPNLIGAFIEGLLPCPAAALTSRGGKSSSIRLFPPRSVLLPMSASLPPCCSWIGIEPRESRGQGVLERGKEREGRVWSSVGMK